MKIEFGIQPNCSEIVCQICGVHTGNVEEFKKKLFEELSDKYAVKYLHDYLSGLCAIENEHCLSLKDHNEDYGVMCKVADGMKEVYSDYVDYCSNYIDNDEDMENYLKRRKETDESKRS